MQIDILLVTYNQEKYIQQALDGIMMQRLNEDVKMCIIVADDCSTDGTLDIIKAYAMKHKAEWVFLPSEKNLGIAENYKRAIAATTADYVAILEGDDYWTDAYKLQKQVDFLEEHSDFSICFHRVKCLMTETGELVDEYMVRDIPGESSVVDLAQGNYIHTPSVVYRQDEVVRKKLISVGACLPGDYVIWMLYADQGKIWKMEEPMAVYRVGSGIWSTSHSYRNELVIIKTLSKLYTAITNPAAKQHIAESISQMSKSNIEYVEYLEKQLKQIQASKAYRFGKLLLKPFRWMRRK